MKICFYGNFSGGGTEKACFGVANGLSKFYDVYILSSSHREPTFDLRDNINFSHLKGKNLFKKYIALYKFIKTNKIDILVSLEALSGIISLIPTKLSHCKYILWEHANYYQTQGSKYIQKIRQLELKWADAYIVLTKRDLNNFKNNFKAKCKLDYIYNIAESVQDVNYDINSKTIVSAGYIRPIKQFDIIPDIGKIVFNKYPDWKWNIYGNAYGQEYEKIVNKVKNYGLEENIIFCGRCYDMNSEYKKSAMYVMTSLQEGLPMVLLEAKAHKLPLVSFDIETGPSEIIRDGVNGYIIEPYSIKAMAKKIINLIENQTLRKEFSDNSLLDIEKFDKQVIVDKWRKLITDLV